MPTATASRATVANFNSTADDGIGQLHSTPGGAGRLPLEEQATPPTYPWWTPQASQHP